VPGPGEDLCNEAESVLPPDVWHGVFWRLGTGNQQNGGGVDPVATPMSDHEDIPPLFQNFPRQYVILHPL